MQQKIDKTDSKLKKRVKIKNFKAKLKKVKQTLRSELDEKLKVICDKEAQLAENFETNKENLEKKFNELERQTLWRIKDTEELLKVRVNEQFVEDSMRKAENFSYKEMHGLKENILLKIDKL